MTNLVQTLSISSQGEASAVVKAFNKKEYREEVSRLSAIANKRIARLEKNNLKDSPAYKRLIKDGVAKFSVRGKSFNEVQSEMSKLNRFLNSETSTIRGINRTLKEMAKNTGIKYKNIADLKAQSTKFFELSDKVEQYLRHVEDMASAVGYNQIWEVINEYTTKSKIDLTDSETDIDSLVEDVSNILAEAKSDKDMFDDILDMGSTDWVFLD